MATYAETESAQPVVVQLTEEEKADAWKEFERIIYANLEKILEKRPAFPVTKFAKAILEDVDLDENGDPILKKKKKKKDKKKKDKKDKKEKKEKKDKGDDKKEKKGKGDKEESKEDKGEKKPKKDKKSKGEAAAEAAH